MPLKGRKRLDIDSSAAQIISQKPDDQERAAVINKAWEMSDMECQGFFKFDKKRFLTGIMNAQKRSLLPGL